MKKVEFRDGTQEVPDHVADYLESFETYQMTYKEALVKMNNRFFDERVRKAQADMVREHLGRYGR